MLLRRYPLRRGGPRTWRPDRDASVVARATRIMEAKPSVKATYVVTNALKAVGEADWATRPGAGTAATVAGTRWKTQTGCTDLCDAVLARATVAQRLTRSLKSTECEGSGKLAADGERGSGGEQRSLTAVETYADGADTVMKARHTI